MDWFPQEMTQLVAQLALEPLPSWNQTSITSLARNGVAVPFDTASLALVQGTLVIVCEGHEAVRTLAHREPTRFRLEGTLADSTRFWSDHGYLRSFALGSMRPSVELGASWPRLLRGPSEPRVWVARPHPDWSLMVQGNLRLEVTKGETRHITLNNLRLDAEHSYLFLDRPEDPDKEHVLLIDTGSSRAPSRDALDRDLRRVQFVLGQPLFFADAYGVETDGTVAAWMGLGIGRKPSDAWTPRPPVPAFRTARLLSSLFDKLTIAERDRPGLHVWLPLAYYVDTIDEHLDGAYLKMHVALEAFAKRVIRETKSSDILLVKDWPAWKKCVEALAPTLGAHAFDPRSAGILSSKILSAGKQSTSSLVSAAFASLGVTLTDELRAEVRGRNAIIHAALMSDPDEDDDDTFARKRVAMIRTLLAALVCAVVGYRDRLVGWDEDKPVELNNPPAEFWSPSDT